MKDANSKFPHVVVGIGICSLLMSVLGGIAVFVISKNSDLIAGNPELVGPVLQLLKAYGYGIWPGISVVVVGIGIELRSIRVNGRRNEAADGKNE